MAAGLHNDHHPDDTGNFNRNLYLTIYSPTVAPLHEGLKMVDRRQERGAKETECWMINLDHWSWRAVTRWGEGTHKSAPCPPKYLSILHHQGRHQQVT